MYHFSNTFYEHKFKYFGYLIEHLIDKLFVVHGIILVHTINKFYCRAIWRSIKLVSKKMTKFIMETWMRIDTMINSLLIESTSKSINYEDEL